jgi:hypothetical protein
VNGLYKTELVERRGPWRSLDELELDTMVEAIHDNQHNTSVALGWGAAVHPGQLTTTLPRS